MRPERRGGNVRDAADAAVTTARWVLMQLPMRGAEGIAAATHARHARSAAVADGSPACCRRSISTTYLTPLGCIPAARERPWGAR
ncbi:unnamed protein product [Schistocephalus solidus]|uniref:Transposase n=1 Tax=Schistocephalus solidus TaxID=70667 RepID=A0A183SSX1_SCHSO|nr:unnamed protein product [Schistocephalus solidus]